jgi:hypothetical protein
MVKSTFWTRRRFTGITLMVGCFLFLGALGLIPRDAQGNFMVNLPLREQLLVIAVQTSLFQWSFSLVISGIIVTLLGLVMLTTLFRDTGDATFSSLALIASLFGGVLMVIFIAFPLGAAPVAAQETVRTGVAPDSYVQLTLGTQPLFVIYTILAFSALAAYGGAILSTRLLPHWMGWLSIIYALAADLVYARKGVVLNPHYKGMGKLYGSEYWTYLLPKRVGACRARDLTEALLPISTRTAHQIGLINAAFEEDAASFRHHIRELAEELARSPRYAHLLAEKRHARQTDEASKPLQAYREEELQQMWQNFFGADRSYHLARKRFVYKGLMPDTAS